MSYVEYNNVGIRLTRTNLFDVQPVRSPDGEDQVAVRFRIDVTGIANRVARPTRPDGSEYFAGTPDDIGRDASAIANFYKDALSQDRGVLRFRYGKKFLVVSHAGDGGGNIVPGMTDSDGGPRVMSVNVMPMGETGTFLVRFSVETTIDSCALGPPTVYALGAGADSVLRSNRWQCAHSIDQDHYTTIRTQGVAVFRLDALQFQNLPADHFRDLCLPAIPPGFRRETVDVSVDSRGRYLTYSVTDHEMPYSLGSGVVNPKALTPAALGVQRFQAQFFARSHPITRGGAFAIAGPMTHCGIAITARGDATSSRKNLLQFCASLAVERLNIQPGRPANGAAVLQSVEVVEHLDTQTVGLTVSAFYPPGAGVDNNLGTGPIWKKLLGIDILPVTFPGDANDMLPGGLQPQLPSDNNTRGTFLGEIVSQKIKEACSIPEPNNRCIVNQGPRSDNYYDCDTRVVVSPTFAIPTPNPNKFKRTDKGIVTDVSIKKNVSTQSNKKAAAVASRKKAGSASSGSGGTGGGGGTKGDTPPGGTTATTDPPAVEVMTLAGGLTLVSVEWTAERLGERPILPSPSPIKGQMELLDTEIEPAAVEVYSDGQTPVYRVSGRFQYAMLKKFEIGKDDIFMGISPHADLEDTDGFLLAEDFDDQVLFRPDSA